MLLLYLIFYCYGCFYFDFVPEMKADPVRIDACLPEFTDSTMEVMSWNLQTFPLTNETGELLKESIQKLDFDLLAIQEIRNIQLFRQVISEFPKYELYLPDTDDLNIGFVYKKSDFELISTEVLFENKTREFPRPVLHIILKTRFYVDNIHVFNLHLKCCGGVKNRMRRTDALDILKTHLDSNYADKRLIILGDFNENIPKSEESSLFNFASDYRKYFITDTYVGLNSKAEWSYPEYPGHLDHIIISDEFFYDFKYFQTLTLDECIEDYLNRISDHRPVFARFESR